MDLFQNKYIMNETYEIVRYYSPTTNKKNRVVKRRLTLKEAREHCSREDTRGKDWFDGYRKEE